MPTPLTENREPDVSIIVAAAEAIAPHLRRGQLVVLESTTYPGTTRELLAPILERGGLRGGRGLPPGVVAGADRPGRNRLTPCDHAQGGRRPHAGCGRGARGSTRLRGHVVPVSSPDAAELVKLLENIFRASTSRWSTSWRCCATDGPRRVGGDRRRGDQAVRLHALLPRPRPGRPLHPDRSVLPLLEGARSSTSRPSSSSWPARSTRACPTTCVERVSRRAERSAEAGLGQHGAGARRRYKPDVGDVRESPAIRLIELLAGLGAEISYHDPHVADLQRRGARPGLDRARRRRARAGRYRLRRDRALRHRLRPHRRPLVAGGRLPQRRSQGQTGGCTRCERAASDRRRRPRLLGPNLARNFSQLPEAELAWCCDADESRHARSAAPVSAGPVHD